MNLSTQLCHELASLARLSVTDDEAVLFARQLAPILRYLQQLNEVEVDGVDLAVPAASGAPMRADDGGPCLDRDAALSQALGTRDGHLVVPKFKED